MSEGNGFFSRTGRRAGSWAANRVARGDMRARSRANYKEARRVAVDALKPKRIVPAEVKAGFEGRYADGGRGRFEEMRAAMDLSDNDLAHLAKRNAIASGIFGVSAFCFTAFGLFLVISADTALASLSGVATLFAALLFASMGITRDFAAWQIEMRAFTGLRTYARARLGHGGRGRALAKTTPGPIAGRR